MTEVFKLEGPALDAELLGAEVERKVRPGPDEPPKRELPPSHALAPPGSSSPVEALLASLSEDADAGQGFPPQSHRKLGSAVVAAKKGFRLALQPIINETFARQNVFNRRLLDTLAALHAENRALAARVERLETQLARDATDS